VDPDPLRNSTLAGGPSIYYKGLHVEIVPYNKLPLGAVFNLVWNPALEARPRHINERFGDNMAMQTVVVEYPKGLPDHVRTAQEATRRKERMTKVQEDWNASAQQSSSRLASGSLSSAEPLSEYYIDPHSGQHFPDGHPDWEGPSSEDEADDKELVAVKSKKLQLNEVVAQQAAARFTGFDTKRMPAPLIGTPTRSANTPWTLVFNNYLERFHPQVKDMEILEKRYGIRAKSELETFANVWYRSGIQEVWGGESPASESFAAERLGTLVELLCGSEEDREFRQYTREFRTMAGDLQRLREPWLGLAPEHDPMHTDEAAFRILEGDVLADLEEANAGTKVMRAAHCLDVRSIRAPEAVTPGCPEAQAACLHLSTALWKMREAYVRCCEY
jgi:hypothetical protein